MPALHFALSHRPVQPLNGEQPMNHAWLLFLFGLILGIWRESTIKVTSLTTSDFDTPPLLRGSQGQIYVLITNVITLGLGLSFVIWEIIFVPNKWYMSLIIIILGFFCYLVIKKILKLSRFLHKILTALSVVIHFISIIGITIICIISFLSK